MMQIIPKEICELLDKLSKTNDADERKKIENEINRLCDENKIM